MNVNFVSPVTVDNSKERESLLGLCRSFYWSHKSDYRVVKESFVWDGEYYRFGSNDAQEFLKVITVLDLALVSFTYYRFPYSYIVVVEEF